MSERLISRSPDLQKLVEDRLELVFHDAYLLVKSVPFVKSDRSVGYGTLVTDLKINDDKTLRPTGGDGHQVWFSEEIPCDAQGKPMRALGARGCNQELFPGCQVQQRFSNKPQGGYPDYYEKMSHYVRLLSNQASAIDPSVSPYNGKPVICETSDSVFHYIDSASCRYGIYSVSQKCAMNKVAIVGLGGTGSYILDLIAKTHIKEIHLFDGDYFVQHNAFRAPGAASLEKLSQNQTKVEYFAGIYSKMRRGVIPHPEKITAENIQALSGFDFVFLCVDQANIKGLIYSFLKDAGIAFIDVGMGLELIKEENSIIGDCRTTLCASGRYDHFPKYVSMAGEAEEDLYDNIQVADLNSLNATLAVIKWKKYCGFYQDQYEELNSSYSLNTHQLTRDEHKHTGTE